jgi:uncharacterized protein YjiS (DUF1127 family)
MSITSATVRLWNGYRRAAAERAALRQLSGVSDHMLRDMGLDRGSLREAVRGRTGR